MPELQTITVQPSGLETYYYRSGSGRPLLYLHHMLGIVGWEQALEELSQTFDVIAPFHPGWGRAKDQLPEVATNLDLVLHYVDFLDALGLERVSIAGISIGAWIAAEFAAIVPGRVERLVLVNPIGIWDEHAQGEDPFAQSPARPTAVLFAQPELRSELLIGDRDPMESSISELLDLRASAKFMWPIPDKGIVHRLPRIKAPTLVVTSERDRVVLPPLGEQWRAGIAGAQLTTLPAAGHLAELEQPAAFAALVRGWVADGKVARSEVEAAAT